jgi:hypothetical protein
MIDAVKIFPATIIIKDHGEENAYIFLIAEAAMVEPVIFSVEGYPVIFIHSTRVVVIIDRTIRYPAIVSQLLGIHAETNYRVIAGKSIGEM